MRPPSAHLPAASRGRARRDAQAGFSLIETLIGLTLLSIALLAQASSVFGEHRLSTEEQYRREALHAAQQLLERLRSDEDWAGLWARLWTLEEAAATPDPGATTLDDGRRAYAPQSYYADFTLTGLLRDVWVLIEVPAAPLDLDPTGPAVLREDLANPALGLPADLNGDGTVDGDARDADYAVLPLRVILRWTPPGEASRELRIATWLRGNR